MVERSREGFVEIVQRAFRTDPTGDAEETIGAVFAMLDTNVSEGEMTQLRETFNTTVRALFARA
ncbi:hypothetical protein P6F26_16295 [Roseibacterium sp. SDUM158017]|nr:DUF2267 domain-containing protein [Roseibacterium sp. SDUM158017]MDG4650008.1 hypothetical protein [Roseibacterium sp. SDUM158017]